MATILVITNLAEIRRSEFCEFLQLGGYSPAIACAHSSEMPEEFSGPIILLMREGNGECTPQEMLGVITPSAQRELICIFEKPAWRAAERSQKSGFNVRWFSRDRISHAALIAFKLLSALGVLPSPSIPVVKNKDIVPLLQNIYLTLAQLIEENRYLRISDLDLAGSSSSTGEIVYDVDLFARIKQIGAASPMAVLYRLWGDATSHIRAHAYYIATQLGIYKNMTPQDIHALIEAINSSNDLPSSHEAFHILELIEALYKHMSNDYRGKRKKSTIQAMREGLCDLVGRFTMSSDQMIRTFAWHLESNLVGNDFPSLKSEDIVGEVNIHLNRARGFDLQSRDPVAEMDKVEVALGVFRRISHRLSSPRFVLETLSDCLESDFWAIRWWSIYNIGAFATANDSRISKRAIESGASILVRQVPPSMHVLALQSILQPCASGSLETRSKSILKTYISNFSSMPAYGDPVKYAQSLLGTAV